jgi:hypothetical protein
MYHCARLKTNLDGYRIAHDTLCSLDVFECLGKMAQELAELLDARLAELNVDYDPKLPMPNGIPPKKILLKAFRPEESLLALWVD